MKIKILHYKIYIIFAWIQQGPTSSIEQNEKANRGIQRRRQKEPINKGGEHQGLQAESAARKQRSNENKSKAGIKPQR